VRTAYQFRLARESDACALAHVTQAAIRTIGRNAYSVEQTEVWASRHPGPQRFLNSLAAGDTIVVAVDGGADGDADTGEPDAPAAYLLLENGAENGGHVDMLYCHPDHSRRGLADALLSHAEPYARARGHTRLFTEASELARPAFERAGFTILHRRDFSVAGVAIHNYAMEKRL